MKLELKHLAGYLPYGLKAEFADYDDIEDTEILTVLSLEIGSEEDFIVNQYSSFFFQFKPILRPLSDLTKEIKVNGEKFVPIDVIGEDIDLNLCDNDYVSDWDEKGGNFLNYIDEFIQRVYNNHHLDFMPFGFIQKLLEWHFDIYGLIENGLAIDINTIK